MKKPTKTQSITPNSRIAGEDLKNIRGGLAGFCIAGDPPADVPSVTCDIDGDGPGEGGGWTTPGPMSSTATAPYDHSLDR